MRPVPVALSAANLRAWRKDCGWTQAQLAEALGRSRRTIQYYEAGTVPVPLQTVILIGVLTPK